jgi:hypothetical protein
MSHKVDDVVIKVRRQWNRGRRIATYRLRDISELRWGRMSGGLRHRTPQLFVHGYVMCDAMIAGTLAHSCAHGPGPHRIKVCLVRKGNESVWKDVLAIVGGRPDRARRGAPAPIPSPMNLPYAQDPQARSSSADGAGGKGQRMHHAGDDAVVEVRQEWNDWRIATYRLRDVSELRWSWRGGGTKRRTPQPFVHGYVMCDEKIGGELAHVCSPGAPHRLKVCLTRTGNESIWKDVAAIVGPRPARTSRRIRRRSRHAPLPSQNASPR